VKDRIKRVGLLILLLLAETGKKGATILLERLEIMPKGKGLVREGVSTDQPIFNTHQPM
jgi:hypothetical protein